MNRPIEWHSFVAPLDFSTLYQPHASLRSWLSYQRLQSGVLFNCQPGAPVGDELGGQVESVLLQVDIISPEILRLRMSRYDIQPHASEMLVQTEWPAQPFELHETEDGLVLLTCRLRVEFRRAPWRMQVFDLTGEPDGPPFFSQQVEDRSYGPAYEVAPIGFERNSDGQISVHEAIAVSPGESFYGFGEKFTSLDKWGQELTSWAVDSGNVSSYRSYKNIPFFMSSAGYGIFVNSSYPMVYRVGSESSQTVSFHILDSQLDYFLIYGPAYKSILSRYSDLTGRAPVPPRWSFGFWISRCGYKNRAEVEEVTAEMRRRGFPCDVLSIDPWWMGEGPWCTYTWDTRFFPEPAEMIANLKRQGVRTCLWIHPYMPAGSPAYLEAQEKGYLVCKADGSPARVLESFTGTDLAALDFTHPEARSWFQAKLERLLEMGVAVFKTDFGEQAPIEAVYHDGRSGLELHNLFPLLYNRAVFELTEQYFGRGLVWGRSGYAGSQRYPVQWGGDSYSSLDQLAGQLRGLLSYGLSGVPFCSHDVGGFDYPPESFDYPNQQNYPKDAETYLRWLQMGVFSSHIRAHGKQPREPWTYGEDAEAIALAYLKLRYRLLPYIYSEAVVSARSGLPMVAPLMLEFQDDSNTQHLDLQYLFGNSFLVAPVVSRAKQRLVYLPKGRWIDFWSKEVQEGNRWLEVKAPLEKIPLWVKGGSILPLGPEMDYVEQQPLDPLTLELYYPEDTCEKIIFQEDAPSIRTAYTCQANRLWVEVGSTPGQVEVVLYGRSASAVEVNDQPATLEECPAGQRVRFDGRSQSRLKFNLRSKKGAKNANR